MHINSYRIASAARGSGGGGQKKAGPEGPAEKF